MATSEGIKQRTVEKPPSTDTTDAAADGAVSPASKDRKTVKARGGLPTLVVALAVPVVLSATSACLSGTTYPGRPDSNMTSSWQPSILAFHLGNIITAALTSLSAWLFWAKGGFHRQPTDLLFYLGHLLLGLAWGPVVLRLHDARLGLAVTVAMLVCLFGCSRFFRRVNPTSGDLIVPCLAWALFLAIFTYKLM